MSFIASMVAASAASAGLVTAGGIGAAALGAAATGAAGAGIGAGISAATGGDIGEGALMGGIGGLGAGAGAALSGATMGASAIGAQGAAATPFAAAAPVASTTAATVAPTATATATPTATATAAPVVENAGLQSSGVVTQGLGANTAPITGEVTSGSLVSPTVNASVGGSAGGSGGISTLPGQPGFVGPQATQGQIANASAYTDANMGTRLLADAFGQQGNIVGNTGLKMAGGALQGGVINSGINGLLAGAKGEDVGEAMGKGALTGAVGGGAGAGLASMAGPSNSGLEYIGNIAAKHDVLVPAALSMGSGMALDSAMTPDFSPPEEKGIRSNYKWNPNVYKPYGPQFAAGGITDLDNYDQAPQMQNPGTLDIPNRNEVANNQGYMGDSVQMMAHGGISDLGGYSDGGVLGSLPGANLMQSVYNTTLGDDISPDLKDFLFGTPDDQLSPEQRRKKAQLMQQEGSSKGMARGGVTNESFMLEGVGGKNLHREASQDLREFLESTPDSELTTAQQRQKQILFAKKMAMGGMAYAHGGISDLGGYSDGGRLLKGPGDGVSDDIPASIGGKQPARLAEGEFVVPARIVSELGNGSTDAGAKRLYQMMDRIQSDRKKTTGKGKFSDNPKASRHLPA